MRLKLDEANLLPGQTQCLQTVHDTDCTFIIWIGTVRAGKGVGAALSLITDAIYRYARTGEYAEYILAGATQSSFINANRMYIYEILEQCGLKYRSKGMPNHAIEVPAIDAVFRIYGGDSANRFQAIRGQTIHGAWIDEATLIHKSFLQETINRISVADGNLILTSNADAPMHYLRTEYIERAADMQIALIESDYNENFHFPDERRRQVIAQTDMMSAHGRRSLLNEWAESEGQIISFSDKIHTYNPERDGEAPADLIGHVVIDEGITGTQAGLLFQPLPNDKWLVRAEDYHIGRLRGQLSAGDHVERIMAKWQPVSLWVDPNANATKPELRNRAIPFQNANTDFERGIRKVNDALHRGDLVVHESCRNLRLEISGYIWNTNESRPEHTPDHLCDSLRYGAMALIKDRPMMEWA